MFNNMQYLTDDPITIYLIVIAVSSAVGVFLVGIWLFRNGPFSTKQKRIKEFVAPEEEAANKKTSSRIKSDELKREIGKFRELVNNYLGRLSSEKLQLQLSSVYWAITDTEFILVRFSLTILAFLLGWLIPSNILGGIFMAAIAFMAPPFILDRAITQRQKKFSNQLLDVMILIKGSVHAGYGFMQALDLAVNEVPNPASEEFGRVIHEINLGLSLEDALFNMVERMDNDDLQIIATAIIINSQVGGNLSTILETSISTVRDRMHLMGEVRSLTSYSRYVGLFLTMLPFLAGGVIFIFSPGYFDTVKTSLITQVIFGGAFLGIIVGNIWISKIVKIKV